jgi:hypothetical protein
LFDGWLMVGCNPVLHVLEPHFHDHLSGAEVHSFWAPVERPMGSSVTKAKYAFAAAAAGTSNSEPSALVTIYNRHEYTSHQNMLSTLWSYSKRSWYVSFVAKVLQD